MCNGTISATASANHYFSLDTFNFTPPHTGVRIVSMCNAPFTPIKERILEYHELLQNEWVFGIGGMEIKVLGEGRRKLVDEFGRFPLKQMFYYLKVEQLMLSMMKLLAEGAKVIMFRGTNCTLVTGFVRWLHSVGNGD